MSTGKEKVQILSAAEARSKINRMAYEIYESNFGVEQLVLIGVNERGTFLADLLTEHLRKISPIEILRIRGNRVKDGVQMETADAAATIRGRAVVIVDDVLYSGRTMFLAIAAVIPHRPARVQTAVLIDRGHRNVPVTHDFVGMLLATTLQQHVSVEIASEETSAIAFVQ